MTTLVLHIHIDNFLRYINCRFLSSLFVKFELQQEVANSDGNWIEEDTSRRAKWWYSTFHIVTAMIGAGVLSLPYAMAYLGWYILD